MKRKVTVIGYDIEVIELLYQIDNIDFLGYVGDKVKNSTCNYLGKDGDYIKSLKKDVEIILSMDNPSTREKLFHLYSENISTFISHYSARISKSSSIGKGSFIQDNVLVSSETKIGKGCFLNHSSALHHESSLGSFSILAPKSLVLGRVNIGNKSYIGAGAIIKENINIGSNVLVGAGSVVINDIDDNIVVAGNPARKI